MFRSMKSAAIAAALTATVALTSVMPAQAQNFSGKGHQRDRVVAEFCSQNSRNDDCRDYKRGRWDNNDYNRFYRNHRGNLDQLAFGLFGLTFAGIVGAAIANDINDDDDYDDNYRRGYRNSGYEDADWQDHVDACHAAYRSYDERSDTYQPYGGVPRRECAL